MAEQRQQLQQLQQQQMRQQQRPPPLFVAEHMLSRVRDILADDTTNVLEQARLVYDDGLAGIWGVCMCGCGWVCVCGVCLCVLCVVCVVCV